VTRQNCIPSKVRTRVAGGSARGARQDVLNACPAPQLCLSPSRRPCVNKRPIFLETGRGRLEGANFRRNHAKSVLFASVFRNSVPAANDGRRRRVERARRLPHAERRRPAPPPRSGHALDGRASCPAGARGRAGRGRQQTLGARGQTCATSSLAVYPLVRDPRPEATCGRSSLKRCCPALSIHRRSVDSPTAGSLERAVARALACHAGAADDRRAACTSTAWRPNADANAAASMRRCARCGQSGYIRCDARLAVVSFVATVALAAWLCGNGYEELVIVPNFVVGDGRARLHIAER